MRSSMRTTRYTHFIPSKAEEEQAAASGIPYQPKIDIVEIRDSSSPNNWRFHKIIHKTSSVEFKGIKFSFDEMVGCIFPHWKPSDHALIDSYNKFQVKVNYFDVDNRLIRSFQGEDIYVKRSKYNSTEYFLMCDPLSWAKPLFSGDEIEVFSTDNEPYTFGLKLIRRRQG